MIHVTRFHADNLRSGRSRTGLALVLVLTILALLTVIVVAILTLASTERSTANMALQRTQAEILADTATDSVMDIITGAISDGSQPNKSWASEPGRIWVFSIDPSGGDITRRSVNLFSALPDTDPSNYDLNAPSLYGDYPIAPPAPGQAASNMKVGWTSYLQNPSSSASSSNPVVGRVAYWVDDESCKVNINTADGSQRTNAYLDKDSIAAMDSSKKYSFGFGTPSEISLAALPGLDQTKAATIAEYAWNQEYNSAAEITRAKDSGGTQAVTMDMFKVLRFDITSYNNSPDLNFMGEPRINLMFRPIAATATDPRLNIHLGAYDKTQRQNGVSAQDWLGLPLDYIYPQPSQLPLPSYLSLNQLFLHTFTSGGEKLTQTGTSTSNDYYVGKIITNFFHGVNLEGRSFAWPKFDGADNAGFEGKYTPRQLDSITLQILDTAGKITFCDQQRPYTEPAIMEKGWLSSLPVLGVARGPRFTEIYIEADTGYMSVGTGTGIPFLQLKLYTESYFPKGFRGAPNSFPYDGSVWQWQYYNGNNGPSYLNYYDYPLVGVTTDPVPTPPPPWVSSNGYPTKPSPLGGYWMDQLLTARDQNGQPAGIDFLGISSLWDDPDPKAALYHPYCLKSDKKTYSGSITQAFTPKPRLQGVLETGTDYPQDVDKSPGCYVTTGSRYRATAHPARPDATSFYLTGGLHLWIVNESSAASAGYAVPTLAPFDSIMPDELRRSASPYVSFFTSPPTGTELEIIKGSIVPVDLSVGVPGIQTLLLRTADPLVNQFPLDWESITNPTPTDVTMVIPAGSGGKPTDYAKGGISSLDPYFPPDATVTTRPSSFDGDNTKFRPSGGGDPLSVWLPIQDIRIPKQARFPSVGALFSVRTGLFPDKTVAARPRNQQHGVAFRGVNFAPSTQSSQRTEGGTSYPDWAMLDLFAVPYLPQKPYMKGDTAKPFRRLTYGGGTVGRMNINNPEIPYPFSETIANVAQTPPKRNALKALFQGLIPSKNYDTNNEPIYSAIDATTSATLARAVSEYQRNNGPFFMAGQIANVPAVADYLYKGNSPNLLPVESISRNDVVRDTIGAITTRSNVYSVWVVAQTVKKRLANTNYGTFENGDIVTSQVRRHYLIERSLDMGKDGVPGNAVSPAVTKTPNAYSLAKPNGDDVNATYQPSLTYPLKYRWKVVSMEEIPL